MELKTASQVYVTPEYGFLQATNTHVSIYLFVIVGAP
jgi:hypothetical protein